MSDEPRRSYDPNSSFIAMRGYSCPDCHTSTTHDPYCPRHPDAAYRMAASASNTEEEKRKKKK